MKFDVNQKVAKELKTRLKSTLGAARPGSAVPDPKDPLKPGMWRTMAEAVSPAQVEAKFTNHLTKANHAKVWDAKLLT